jgi:hypothetical protein
VYRPLRFRRWLYAAEAGLHSPFLQPLQVPTSAARRTLWGPHVDVGPAGHRCPDPAESAMADVKVAFHLPYIEVSNAWGNNRALGGVNVVAAALIALASQPPTKVPDGKR